jgi:hypothetical protein
MSRQPPRPEAGPATTSGAATTPPVGRADAPRPPADGAESRHRRRPAPAARDPRPNRVLRPTLTEPDTTPMSADQHEQAVTALAAMIVAWLQRRALDDHTPPQP